MPTISPTQVQQRNAVQVKLEEVAEHLQHVFTKDSDVQPLVSPPDIQIDRKDVSEEIKRLEDALNLLPQDNSLENARNELTAKISEKKQMIHSSKPIGARLDDTRGLVGRCVARREQALKSLDLAQQALAAADEELADAQLKLQKLEAEMAHTESRPPATSSIEDLATSLTKSISDIQKSAAVPDEMVNQTEHLMRLLMDGVRAMAVAAAVPPRTKESGAQAQAPETRAASPSAKKSIPKRTKLIGKGPGIASQDAYDSSLSEMETEEMLVGDAKQTLA